MNNVPGQVGKVANYFGEIGINIQEISTMVESDEELNSDIDIFLGVEASPNVTASKIISDLLIINGIKSVKKVM